MGRMSCAGKDFLAKAGRGAGLQATICCRVMGLATSSGKVAMTLSWCTITSHKGLDAPSVVAPGDMARWAIKCHSHISRWHISLALH